MTRPDPREYQFPDPSLTLGQALAWHRARVPGFIEGDDAVSRALFGAHDAVHVLFGCGTSMADEGRADGWTLLATTMTFREYLAFAQHPVTKALFASLTARDWLASFAGLVDLPRMWWRARQMTRPWPFDRYTEHLDRTLAEIRAEYHITPTHLPATVGGAWSEGAARGVEGSAQPG